MPAIYDPAGPLGQLANLFFILSAVFSDLLLLRFALVVANACLVANAAIGFPSWHGSPGSGIAVDALIWSSVALSLHLWAFIRLLWDERPVPPFDDPDEEALFHLFASRAGIGRSDFLAILEKAEWTRVPETGTHVDASDRFYIIVEGLVQCKIKGWRRRLAEEPHQMEQSIDLGSGDMFDLSLTNCFGLPIGFYNERFDATTLLPNALIVGWSRDALEGFAYRSPPVVAQAWKNLIAYEVADVAHRHRNHPSFVGQEAVERAKRHRDFEAGNGGQKRSWWAATKSFLFWIIKSMDPRPVKGLRHHAAPAQFIVERDMHRHPVGLHGHQV